MMVVSVQIWPGGDESSRFEIGRMEVSNMSNLAEFSDYHAHVIQQSALGLDVNAIDRIVRVKGHPRREGAWALVKRVLDRLHG
ncbi:hypothetical protein [Sphingobium fuliginis]|uniref:Uncharacterized protein n=1 Tax=Sphingobium fuliginis (strain ATCC 27551) TaxID=336203 RepID=A0ABQ1EZ59_SPHSA|nr:hypothetical protein [Sphingobium fuliginis]RYL97646.1 hypothetical protein EWH10_13970 [Sphingobium fuliginis]GFZ93971.1 hypothetical protein GCM10019071_25310 [Sphingobium fuliginis]